MIRAALLASCFIPAALSLVIARRDRQRRLIAAARRPIGNRYAQTSTTPALRAASAGASSGGGFDPIEHTGGLLVPAGDPAALRRDTRSAAGQLGSSRHS